MRFKGKAFKKIAVFFIVKKKIYLLKVKLRPFQSGHSQSCFLIFLFFHLFKQTNDIIHKKNTRPTI